MGAFNDPAGTKPGKTGESLDGKDNVVRLGLEQSNYNRIGANHFRLSSNEKDSDWKRISVWESSLTTIEEARSIVTNPKRKLILDLNVGDVRSIAINAQVELDVKWDRLPDCIDGKGNRGSNYRDGCEGHCAMDGIYPKGKKLRKRIRRKLADLAMSSEWYVIDE
jgi:hypothetical protein